MRKYQPSTGTEGMDFCEEFCWQCINCDPDPSGPKQCEILCMLMALSISDPDYPKELVQNDDGSNPRCTSWTKWDWGNDGNPDDPENPKAPPPYNPDQLDLFPLYPDETHFEKDKLKVLIA